MNSRRTSVLPIWLGYLLFVVYGSLVPLEFRPLPLGEACSVFRDIPLYHLGVESRADWIANGVLYVPLAFLSVQLARRHFPQAQRTASFLGAAFCVALAFAIEFTQIFFPARTVSANDLIAETTGSLIGLLLAARHGTYFDRLLHELSGHSRQLGRHLLELYLVAYLAFSLFPYDLLLSAGEVEQKLNGGNWGVWLAGNQHGVVLIVLKLLAEVVLTLPFGVFLASRRQGRGATYWQALLQGIVLGALIEIAQFFIASGVSQGVSVLTRAAGVVAGLALWRQRDALSGARLRAFARRRWPLLLAIYLPLLLLANGWLTHRWSGWDHAAAHWDAVRLLPFYQHYYTSEAHAIVSLATVCLMYLPVALLAWSSERSVGPACLAALVAASVSEAGKLFMIGTLPDPTNVLLAVLSCWAAFQLLTRLATTASPSAMPTTHGDVTPAAGWHAYLACALVVAFVGSRLATFPSYALALAGLFAACAATVWRYPVAVFAIVAAALPVLDLAPWSGRYYLDEFDLLLVLCLAIAYVRIPRTTRARRPADTLLALAGGALAISYAVAAWRGLTPWQIPDANAFNNYYSPYNALRIVKGAVWALALYGVLRRASAAAFDVQKAVSHGMVAGLALTVAVVFWERVAFSGLFNYASDYRVTGPFSAMHTGGAYIECYLTVAAPFVLAVLLETRRWTVRIGAALLLLATTYALMVTFSRNGYLAFCITLLIALGFATLRSPRRRQRGVLGALLGTAIVAIALPVFTGQFAQQRIATIGQDLRVREAHWRDALEMRAPDVATRLLGTGLGRFPETHYFLSRDEGHSGSYRLQNEAGNTYLRLVSGSSIYVEQLVAVRAREQYVLRFDARADRRDATLTVPICEKWLLTSFNCMWSTASLGGVPGHWRHFEFKLSADTLLASRWYAQRPIKLALYNGDRQSAIDVDNIRLENAQGESLLANGDFSHGLDHWFFSTDSHLPWHIKSLPLSVYFEQGAFGLIAWALLAALAIGRCARRAWHADPYAGATLAAIGGFLVVGAFDTLIDSPRFLLLLLLLAQLGAFRWYPAARRTASN